MTGIPALAKIESLVDRNGNTMTFTYDGTRRLEKVTDTLGRDILIAYTAGGKIKSITDFTGREVTDLRSPSLPSGSEEG